MPNCKLYVGNLNYSTNNKQLEELFLQYGDVKHINIIEGKGFGFVEMSLAEEAERAKEALNGSEFEGRPLKVANAFPPNRKPKGGLKKKNNNLKSPYMNYRSE
ncbi:MAG: RNA recognition motif domain-containing protein [bacterium]